MLVTQVLFIDFGNSEEVPVEKICSLTPELAVFPKQAMPCKGHGIYPLAGTEWDVEATSRLNDLVNRDDLMATVLSVRHRFPYINLELILCAPDFKRPGLSTGS